MMTHPGHPRNCTCRIKQEEQWTRVCVRKVIGPPEPQFPQLEGIPKSLCLCAACTLHTELETGAGFLYKTWTRCEAVIVNTAWLRPKNLPGEVGGRINPMKCGTQV